MSLIRRRVYRKLVPKIFRGDYLIRSLKKDIIDYYSALPADQLTEEQLEMREYLKVNPIAVFPYKFQNEYNPDTLTVFMDDALGLRYLMAGGKRLYFKRRYSEEDVRHYYNELRKEQDLNSPHRYLSDDFTVEDGDVVADIGAAEGNFSLDVAEKSGRLYLFETDEEWIEALNATFSPWKEKVHIIKKRVSDKNDRDNTTMDDFFKGKDRVNFLKVDVDGAERELLRGSERILSEQGSLKIALCVYHKQDDEVMFSQLLEGKGFEVSHTDGYMIFIFDKQLDAPYLRRGLIRATRSSNV
jgi:hypothetical protein